MASLWQPFELFNSSFSTPQHGRQLEDPGPLPRWDVGENGRRQSLVPSLEAVSKCTVRMWWASCISACRTWLNSTSKSVEVQAGSLYTTPITNDCTSHQHLPEHSSSSSRPPVSNFLLISCQFISALFLKPTVVNIMLTAGLPFQHLFVTIDCPFAIRMVVGSHVPLSVLVFFFFSRYTASLAGEHCAWWTWPLLFPLIGAAHLDPPARIPLTNSQGFRILRPRCPLIGDNLLTQLLVLKFTSPLIILG